jgi:DNA mismatch repair ATPase MutS
MILYTDEQTIADLGIFGKRDREGIFELYNRTQTRGGEGVLKDMFLHPLSNKEAISQRSSVIDHFARLNMAFPFESALIDTTEKYIKEPGEQDSGNRQQRTLSDKDIQLGVLSVIAIMQQCHFFIETKTVKGIAAYEPERTAIESLITDAAFAPVLRERDKKLSYSAVAAYDVLFRERERSKLEQLLRFIYNLDVYIAVAKVAMDKELVFPVALDKGACVLKLEGVYHPALNNAVGNAFNMHSAQQVIFLTGANMAGKSTFLRAVSTAVYTAHMGFPVAATVMEFSVMDGMYTTINLPDNLGIGASHFYAEVLRVKKIATELNQGRSLFIVFDELFRGTNVKDAAEATVAVSRAFAGRTTSMFIISSHIVEAGEALKQCSNIGFCYLPTRMNGHTPEYTYTLQQGITDDRHGMIIIKKEGILDILKKPKNTL